MTKRGPATLTEPLVLFLIFVGVGIGTLTLPQSTRLAALWSTLAALTLFHWARAGVELELSLPQVGRGALLALVISLPLLAFLSTQLRIFAERLHATQNAVLLFYQVCFISAPVEEAFFRGVIFEEKGSSAAAGFYAASAFLFYAPHVPILVALLVTLAMSLLGVVYGHVRERYGLVAAIASHVVAGFTLQVLPSWLDALRTLLI